MHNSGATNAISCVLAGAQVLVAGFRTTARVVVGGAPDEVSNVAVMMVRATAMAANQLDAAVGTDTRRAGHTTPNRQEYHPADDNARWTAAYRSHGFGGKRELPTEFEQTALV